MDIKIIGEDGKEAVNQPQPQESERNISSPVLPELEIAEIADLFDISRKETGKYSDQLDTLLQYAKTQTDDHSIMNLKWVIRSLELKLGTPPLAEKRITFLSRYAYLLGEEAQIQKEKEKFERR